MKYGQFGYYDPDSEYCGKFKSPNYKAWLIMIMPDSRINSSVYGTMNLFVDVNTGEYEEIRADGQISDIEWDRSFFVTTYNPD